MEWTNFIDPQLSHALTIAMIRSIWISGIIWLIALMAIKGQIFRSSTSIYRFLLLCTGIITAATIHYFMQAYNASSLIITPDLTDLVVPGSNTSGYAVNPHADLYTRHWPLIIWMLGFITFSFRPLAGLFHLAHIHKRLVPLRDPWKSRIREIQKQFSIPLPVHAGQNSNVHIPFVYGILRPTIVFPAAYFSNMNPRELEAIIMHEMIHIKKFDFLVNILQSICESVLFFNPVIWWLGQESRKYREYRVDDAVKGELQQTNDYALALLKAGTIAHRSSLVAIKLHEGKQDLLQRINRMLRQDGRRVSYPIFSLLISICLVVALFGFKGLEDNEEKIKNGSLTPDLEIIPFDQKENTTIPVVPVQSLNRSSPSEHVFLTQDTIPSDEQIRQIKKQIEEKQQHIEQLHLQMEKHIEEELEPLTLKMKEIQLNFEREIVPKMEAMEKEFMQSEEFKEMELLQKKYEAELSEVELLLESAEYEEKMKELEEELSRKLELQETMEINLDSIDPKKFQQLHLEIETLKRQMEETTHEMSEEVEEMMNNPELQEIMVQMQDLQLNIKPIRHQQEKIQREMMLEYQTEMSEIQEEIQSQMKSAQSEIHTEMKVLQEEMSELHESLRKELHKSFDREE